MEHQSLYRGFLAGTASMILLAEEPEKWNINRCTEAILLGPPPRSYWLKNRRNGTSIVVQRLYYWDRLQDPIG
ncbi:hypothetical protein DNTS_032589 [Danionella cerebrum]|uniref:Uncharacterized protein n=1 Tax=Danionella cerebrum TaxID=2873325 RepID=A0A553PYB4_9TELE|nr:hypothetical protein DNTS_032589 [Danionella translucida]